MPAPHKAKKKSIGQMRIASVGALLLTLTILGAIALVRIVASGLEQDFKERLSFDVELPEHYTIESYRELETELRKVEGIKQTTYISADSALSYVREKMGEDPSKLLGYNPLSPMLRIGVSADYLESDSLKTIQSHLSHLGLDVERLDMQQGQSLSAINRNASMLEYLLLALVAVQAIFTFVQINNTTRMMIYAERLRIRTLTLVGASSWFIRRPIVWRSLLDGLVASILSFALLALIVWVLEHTWGIGIFSLLDPMQIYIASAGILLIALLASGLASLRATGRYIHMDGRRIHLV